MSRVGKPKRDRHAVDLRRHAELAPAQPGDVLVTMSVGPRNEAIAVWSDPPGRQALHGRTTQPGGASFADPATAVGVAVRVVTYAPGITAVVRVPELRLAHCHVQPLPDDQILIVAARCRWRPDHPDTNAVVLNPDGSVARRAVLGDGIGHVLATDSGKIWVGYFDEGVYGNYGWGNPRPEPIGAPGAPPRRVLAQCPSNRPPAHPIPDHDGLDFLLDGIEAHISS